MTKFTDKKRAEFLAKLRQGKSIYGAAGEIGISREALYQRRRKDDTFRAEWEEAVENGTDRLEDEAYRRAFDGVEEPVFYQGHKVGQVKRYSDTLLIFQLKARRPEKYRETHHHEHTGKDGGPIEHEDVSAREQIESRIAGIASRISAEVDPRKLN